MIEADFQGEITSSIKYYYPFAHYYKIPDPRVYDNKNRKRPYDCYGIIKGKFFAFELKQMKMPHAFPLREIEPHQIKALKEVRDNKGMAYFLINYRFNLSRIQMTRYRFRRRHMNIAVYFNVNEIISIKKSGVKSISFPDIFMNPHRIEWIPNKKKWEINNLIDKEIIKVVNKL